MVFYPKDKLKGRLRIFEKGRRKEGRYEMVIPTYWNKKTYVTLVM